MVPSDSIRNLFSKAEELLEFYVEKFTKSKIYAIRTAYEKRIDETLEDFLCAAAGRFNQWPDHFEGWDVNISDIKRLDLLWGRIYPYLADYVMSFLPGGAQEVLELGPFSGGISFELARARRNYSIVIADERQDVLDYLAREAEKQNLLHRIRLEQTTLSPLKFEDCEFDAVISRGVFFFLDEPILKEMYRILRPGGIGFIGGGFGISTPRVLIDDIASESRRLNQRLGKKWISEAQLREMVISAGLGEYARIINEGGLWLRVEK
ncbi:MAG: methyltransferase domain-containing protein [Proteobacteria bacterium]|nr:methyltransferase domain-containing protein [Pseudomonadota bacterium]